MVTVRAACVWQLWLDEMDNLCGRKLGVLIAQLHRTILIIDVALCVRAASRLLALFCRIGNVIGHGYPIALRYITMGKIGYKQQFRHDDDDAVVVGDS
jgi:hypothetical protein